MKIKNWNIGLWLLSGFSLILIFVLLISTVSYRQTNQLSQQTETMYNHPLTVRRSIDELIMEISNIRLEIRNYILVDSDDQKLDSITNINISKQIITEEFLVLEDRYLGPESDLHDVHRSYITWITAVDQNIDVLEAGNENTVIDSIAPGGKDDLLLRDLLQDISVMDDFAQSKSDELLTTSHDLHDQMVFQLVTISTTLFLLTLIVGTSLYYSFKVPLGEMNETVLGFQSGNMKIRNKYQSNNELGILSRSINDMADSIEENEILHTISNDFADKLISESTMDEFTTIVIQSLMTYTSSVSSAIYLYDSPQQDYIMYDSIGFDSEKLKKFNNHRFKAEFEQVLTTQEVTIVDIQTDDSQFVYSTVTSGVLPKEIMTIPIVSNNEVIGIITLATLNGYTSLEKRIVDNLIDNLTSRVESILASVKIDDFVEELEQRSNELEEQNAELELQKQRLNEASNLKSTFLSNMSHELRTPLNSVIALSDVLDDRLKGQIPEEEYSYLEIIGRNGRNLLNLINDILDVSRIESGRVEIDSSSFNVNAMVKDIYNMFHVTASSKGIHLEHIRSQEVFYVTTDYDKCFHIVQNLVSNAVKFTKEGSVTMKVSATNGDFEIAIKDTGIGISQDHLENIFEEFKQAESSTSRRFGGTGLGLSIARRYAVLLGGNVTVESTVGEGSTFTLRLPRQYKGLTVIESKLMQTSPMQYEQNNTQSDDSLNDNNVLLIDDNLSVVIQIKDLVKGMDINLITATNGKDGLSILKHQKIDAIILDLMMPEIDGFEVLKQIRNNDVTADIPVLILTAKHLTKSDLSELKRNNIHQLVQKGNVDRIDLKRSIFNMLYKSVEPPQTISRDHKPTILVVEDNEDNRTTIHAIINDLGEVLIAEDGEEAIEMARKHNPDLILMDIALPKVSGIEAFYEIRKIERLKSVPIVAVTASALEPEKKKILSHGFNGFVPKPITSNELLQTINEVLYDD